LDFISSDETLDRYGEVITAAGWKLATYQRNPVFQNSHQYGDILFTLGRALITEVRQVRSADSPVRAADALPSDGRGIKGEGSVALFQRIQFAVDANPMARIAYNLYKGKFLNAVSVGFIPIKWEDGKESSSLAAPKSDVGGSSIPLRRYLEQELLEVSAVAIPANPNALALALKSGAVEKSDLRDLCDLIHLTLAAPSRNTEHETRITFLRQLHTILKS
jgi:hypothetical protein